MSEAPANATRRARIGVRWKMFTFMFAFGAFAYVQQKGIAVAALRMMPDLGITQQQIGWLQAAFIAGYAVMQFPGGLLGQRFRPRVVFMLLGFGACAAALVVPLAPLVLVGAPLFTTLLLGRALLGALQAPVFPLTNGIFEVWFPPRQWPLVQGLASMCLGIGLAIVAPLVAGLMESFGWRLALVCTNLPMLLLTILWVWYGRNTPAEHPAMTPQELAEIGTYASENPPQPFSWQRVWQLCKNSDVLVLTGSYLCDNYAFYLIADWAFLYLVQERHVTALEGGLLAATPALVGSVGAGIGGYLATLLGIRLGVRRGLRLIPLVCLPACAVLLLVTVSASTAYLAVAALSLCFACQQINEGPYWAAVMHCAPTDTMAAGGLLNMGGNAGGLIAAPVTAYFSGNGQWTPPFLIAAALALVAGVAWLYVNPERHAVGAAATAQRTAVAVAR